MPARSRPAAPEAAAADAAGDVRSTERDAPTATGLDEQLCFSLYAATNTITRAYRPLLRQMGLTYPQYLVMLVLWDEDGTPTRQIADRLDLPANALSPLVDRLERGGLVTRRPDDHDRRVHRIHLTRAGRELRGAAGAAQASVADTTRLSGEEQQLLRDLLGRLFTEPASSGNDPDQVTG